MGEATARQIIALDLGDAPWGGGMTDKASFNMEQGSIVKPGSADWFRTVSFGDVIKIMTMLAGIAGYYAYNETRAGRIEERQTTVEHSMVNALAEMHSMQRDLRDSEQSQRVEFLHQIERLTDRLDGMRNKGG